MKEPTIDDMHTCYEEGVYPYLEIGCNSVYRFENADAVQSYKKKIIRSINKAKKFDKVKSLNVRVFLERVRDDCQRRNKSTGSCIEIMGLDYLINELAKLGFKGDT